MAQHDTTSIEMPCGDEAVRAKTGKVWSQWLATLDAAGAAELRHKEIAAYLDDTYDFGGWWAQMVTVGYERARGRRAVHQKTDGYEANASRTLNVPLERLSAAWTDASLRQQWLDGAELTVRGATPGKSLRAVCSDGSSIDVRFYPKGEQKSQVSLQHSKLPDAEAVARSKAYWQARLERLKAQLEA